MISEEDFVVASLAKLVGSELNTIDNNTEGNRRGTANRLNPRDFITSGSFQKNKPVGNTVKHDGMMFHAGVDESLVQSMYPDPVSTLPVQNVPVQNEPLRAPPLGRAIHTPETPATATPAIITLSFNEYNENLLKVLKSIDKTLKSIDKTEKTLAALITPHSSNTSD